MDPKLQSCVHLSYLNSVLAALAELFPSSAFPEVLRSLKGHHAQLKCSSTALVGLAEQMIQDVDD